MKVLPLWERKGDYLIKKKNNNNNKAG